MAGVKVQITKKPSVARVEDLTVTFSGLSRAQVLAMRNALDHWSERSIAVLPLAEALATETVGVFTAWKPS